MSHSVYILECFDKTLYTGSTCDLEKRLHEHNNTKAGAKYTRGRRPVKLVHLEKFRTLSRARRREAEIKKLTRAQKEVLVDGSFSSQKNLFR